MIMKRRSNKSFVLAALTLGVLSGCGESGIEEIKARELESVQRATEAQAEVQAQAQALAQLELEEEAQAMPSAGAATPEVDTGDMELLFSDEFNGNEIDSAKWNTALTWGPDLVINNELQYYVDAQSNPDYGYNPFRFDGESLIISSIKTPQNLLTTANNQPYLSGVITSASKFAMTFGYIEARMDFPVGTGMWPAFWMLSSEFKSLKPQLFIAEGNGAEPESVFHNYNYHDADGNLRSPGQWQVTQQDFAEGFHTLGVSWKSEELLFYIDGEPRYRIVGENIPKQAMYLIANLAVGGVWAGAPDSSTTYPAKLKIDYIRAYRHTGN